MKAVTKGMVEHNINRVLFLAGTPNKPPSHKLNFSIKLLKLFLIGIMGNKWNMEDNDGAIAVLTSQNDIEYIVIRPLFMLGKTPKYELKPSTSIGGIVSFADLGAFVVRSVQDNNLVEKFSYVLK